MKAWCLALFAAWIAGAIPAIARECDVTITEHATIAAVDANGTLDLTDGRRLRLAAIQSPRAEWPLADEGRAALAALAGTTIDLAFADRGTDRHGDLIAHVFKGDTWLQADLIDKGLARVATRSDTNRCAAALLKREAAARIVRRGIWANAFYRVRKPDELGADIGTFQLVEAKVAAVKSTRDRTYVNFGADYRTDFTVAIAARDGKRLAKQGIDPAAWTGKTVRVRGWLSLLNGPEIELTHAEQLELLD